MSKETEKKGPLDIFIRNIERERKKEKKETTIEVLDRGDIEKRYGKGYLDLFKPFLISARCETFSLVYCPKEDSFWYSVHRGGIAVNFACLPDKGKFETSDRNTSEV